MGFRGQVQMGTRSAQDRVDDMSYVHGAEIVAIQRRGPRRGQARAAR